MFAGELVGLRSNWLLLFVFSFVCFVGSLISSLVVFVLFLWFCGFSVFLFGFEHVFSCVIVWGMWVWPNTVRSELHGARGEAVQQQENYLLRAARDCGGGGADLRLQVRGAPCFKILTKQILES